MNETNFGPTSSCQQRAAWCTGQSGKSDCGLVLGGWVYKQVYVKFVGFEVFLITAFVFPLPLDSISLSERPLLLKGG